MAFTYVGDLSTDLDKVRFYINDKVASSGPLPSGTNFTDAELEGLITTEGSWERAVAGAFEVLTSAYAGLVDFAIGPRKESLSQTRDTFKDLADDWRTKYGTATTSTVGTRAMTRVDGYSNDVAADDV